MAELDCHRFYNHPDVFFVENSRVAFPLLLLVVAVVVLDRLGVERDGARQVTGGNRSHGAAHVQSGRQCFVMPAG